MIDSLICEWLKGLLNWLPSLGRQKSSIGIGWGVISLPSSTINRYLSYVFMRDRNFLWTPIKKGIKF
jgi:hypothetical protein